MNLSEVDLAYFIVCQKLYLKVPDLKMQQKRERVPLIFFGTILRVFQCKENILLMSTILWNMEGMESSDCQ